jgi:hypothetical protein
MATGFYHYAMQLFLEAIKPVTEEGIRLLPDSLLYGSGLLSLITYQTPMMFLFLATALSFIATNLISAGADTFFPQDVVPASGSRDQCISGIFSPTISRITLLPELTNTSGFPSPSVMVLSSFLFYCITSVLQQSDVLNQLGDNHKAKLPIVASFGSILLAIMVIYMVYYNCSGFMTVMISIIAGGAVGATLSVLFSLVFGQESINLLGLPLFVRRDKTGQPLYICASKN